MPQNNRPYKSRFRPALRSIALTLVISFLVSDISHAAPGVNLSFFSGDLAANPSLLKFPAQTAKITEIFRAPQKEKQKLLIHIQDAHTNFSAQENISKVLEDLASRYKVKTIFVEGGTGDDSLSFIRPLAPKKTRERVAKKYLLAGEIKGVEYLDLVSDHTLTVWGVEDKALYDKNLKTYAAIAAGREAALGYLSEIERRVCMLKEKFFTKELKSFDDCAEAFEKKEKDFSEYHSALSTAAAKAGVNLFGYPNFLSLEKLKAAEENIDFKKATQEQNELLRTVFQNAAEREEALALLSGEVSKLKSTSVSSAFIYEALLERAQSAGLNPSSYAKLAKYTDYLKTFANVDPQKLFEETKNLKAQIYREALGKDDDAMYLHEISDYLSHLKALYSLQISKEDFEAYMAYRKDVRFETIVLLAFLNKHLYDLGRAGDVQRFLQLIDDNRKAVEDFYHTNESRDQSFVDKALKAMDKDNISTAVLIAGGYHTSNLKQLLKSRGVSYAIVTPQISQETNIKRYEEILLGQLGDENPLVKKTVTANGAKTLAEAMVMDRPVDLIVRSIAEEVTGINLVDMKTGNPRDFESQIEKYAPTAVPTLVYKTAPASARLAAMTPSTDLSKPRSKIRIALYVLATGFVLLWVNFAWQLKSGRFKFVRMTSPFTARVNHEYRTFINRDGEEVTVPPDHDPVRISVQEWLVIPFPIYLRQIDLLHVRGAKNVKPDTGILAEPRIRNTVEPSIVPQSEPQPEPQEPAIAGAKSTLDHVVNIQRKSETGNQIEIRTEPDGSIYSKNILAYKYDPKTRTVTVYGPSTVVKKDGVYDDFGNLKVKSVYSHRELEKYVGTLEKMINVLENLIKELSRISELTDQERQDIEAIVAALRAEIKQTKAAQKTQTISPRSPSRIKLNSPLRIKLNQEKDGARMANKNYQEFTIPTPERITAPYIQRTAIPKTDYRRPINAAETNLRWSLGKQTHTFHISGVDFNQPNPINANLMKFMEPNAGLLKKIFGPREAAAKTLDGILFFYTPDVSRAYRDVQLPNGKWIHATPGASIHNNLLLVDLSRPIDDISREVSQLLDSMGARLGYLDYETSGKQYVVRGGTMSGQLAFEWLQQAGAPVNNITVLDSGDSSSSYTSGNISEFLRSELPMGTRIKTSAARLTEVTIGREAHLIHLNDKVEIPAQFKVRRVSGDEIDFEIMAAEPVDNLFLKLDYKVTSKSFNQSEITYQILTLDVDKDALVQDESVSYNPRLKSSQKGPARTFAQDLDPIIHGLSKKILNAETVQSVFSMIDAARLAEAKTSKTNPILTVQVRASNRNKITISVRHKYSEGSTSYFSWDFLPGKFKPFDDLREDDLENRYAQVAQFISSQLDENLPANWNGSIGFAELTIRNLVRSLKDKTIPVPSATEASVDSSVSVGARLAGGFSEALDELWGGIADLLTSFRYTLAGGLIHFAVFNLRDTGSAKDFLTEAIGQIKIGRIAEASANIKKAATSLEKTGTDNAWYSLDALWMASRILGYRSPVDAARMASRKKASSLEEYRVFNFSRGRLQEVISRAAGVAVRNAVLMHSDSWSVHLKNASYTSSTPITLEPISTRSFTSDAPVPFKTEDELSALIRTLDKRLSEVQEGISLFVEVKDNRVVVTEYEKSSAKKFAAARMATTDPQAWRTSKDGLNLPDWFLRAPTNVMDGPRAVVGRILYFTVYLALSFAFITKFFMIHTYLTDKIVYYGYFEPLFINIAVAVAAWFAVYFVKPPAVPAEATALTDQVSLRYLIRTVSVYSERSPFAASIPGRSTSNKGADRFLKHSDLQPLHEWTVTVLSYLRDLESELYLITRADYEDVVMESKPKMNFDGRDTDWNETLSRLFDSAATYRPSAQEAYVDALLAENITALSKARDDLIKELARDPRLNSDGIIARFGQIVQGISELSAEQRRDELAKVSSAIKTVLTRTVDLPLDRAVVAETQKKPTAARMAEGRLMLMRFVGKQLWVYERETDQVMQIRVDQTDPASDSVRLQLIESDIPLTDWRSIPSEPFSIYDQIDLFERNSAGVFIDFDTKRFTNFTVKIGFPGLPLGAIVMRPEIARRENVTSIKARLIQFNQDRLADFRRIYRETLQAYVSAQKEQKSDLAREAEDALLKFVESLARNHITEEDFGRTSIENEMNAVLDLITGMDSRPRSLELSQALEIADELLPVAAARMAASLSRADEERLDKTARTLISRAEEKFGKGEPVVFVLDGNSASGKGALADAIERELRKRYPDRPKSDVNIIRQDWFQNRKKVRLLTEQRIMKKVTVSEPYTEEFDYAWRGGEAKKLLDQAIPFALNKNKNGESFKRRIHRAWIRERDRFSPKSISIPAASYLIVEGKYALRSITPTLGQNIVVIRLTLKEATAIDRFAVRAGSLGTSESELVRKGHVMSQIYTPSWRTYEETTADRVDFLVDEIGRVTDRAKKIEHATTKKSPKKANKTAARLATFPVIPSAVEGSKNKISPLGPLASVEMTSSPAPARRSNSVGGRLARSYPAGRDELPAVFGRIFDELRGNKSGPFKIVLDDESIGRSEGREGFVKAANDVAELRPMSPEFKITVKGRKIRVETLDRKQYPPFKERIERSRRDFTEAFLLSVVTSFYGVYLLFWERSAIGLTFAIALLVTAFFKGRHVYKNFSSFFIEYNMGIRPTDRDNAEFTAAEAFARRSQAARMAMSAEDTFISSSSKSILRAGAQADPVKALKRLFPRLISAANDASHPEWTGRALKVAFDSIKQPKDQRRFAILIADAFITEAQGLDIEPDDINLPQVHKDKPTVWTVTTSPTIDIDAQGRLKNWNDPKGLLVGPGGGGLNVAIALSRLGLHARPIFFHSGKTGQRLLRLLQKRMVDTSDAIDIGRDDDEGRVTLVVNQSDKTNNLVPKATPVPEDAQERMRQKLLNETDGVKKGDIVVISGGLAPEIPEQFYADLGIELKKRGAIVIVDTKGKPAKIVLEKGAASVVSMNQLEFSELVGIKTTENGITEAETRELIKKASEVIKRIPRGQGVEEIVVTLGAQGAFSVTRDRIWQALAPPIDEVKSEVGAGDTSLAQRVYKLWESDGKDPENAFLAGIAAGTESVRHPGTGGGVQAGVETLFKKVDLIEHVLVENPFRRGVRPSAKILRSDRLTVLATSLIAVGVYVAGLVGKFYEELISYGVPTPVALSLSVMRLDSLALHIFRELHDHLGKFIYYITAEGRKKSGTDGEKAGRRVGVLEGETIFAVLDPLEGTEHIAVGQPDPGGAGGSSSYGLGPLAQAMGPVPDELGAGMVIFGVSSADKMKRFLPKFGGTPIDPDAPIEETLRMAAEANNVTLDDLDVYLMDRNRLETEYRKPLRDLKNKSYPKLNIIEVHHGSSDQALKAILGQKDGRIPVFIGTAGASEAVNSYLQALLFDDVAVGVKLYGDYSKTIGDAVGSLKRTLGNLTPEEMDSVRLKVPEVDTLPKDVQIRYLFSPKMGDLLLKELKRSDGRAILSPRGRLFHNESIVYPKAPGDTEVIQLLDDRGNAIELVKGVKWDDLMLSSATPFLLSSRILGITNETGDSIVIREPFPGSFEVPTIIVERREGKTYVWIEYVPVEKSTLEKILPQQFPVLPKATSPVPATIQAARLTPKSLDPKSEFPIGEFVVRAATTSYGIRIGISTPAWQSRRAYKIADVKNALETLREISSIGIDIETSEENSQIPRNRVRLYDTGRTRFFDFKWNDHGEFASAMNWVINAKAAQEATDGNILITGGNPIKLKRLASFEVGIDLKGPSDESAHKERKILSLAELHQNLEEVLRQWPLLHNRIQISEYNEIGMEAYFTLQIGPRGVILRYPLAAAGGVSPFGKYNIDEYINNYIQAINLIVNHAARLANDIKLTPLQKEAEGLLERVERVRTFDGLYRLVTRLEKLEGLSFGAAVRHIETMRPGSQADRLEFAKKFLRLFHASWGEDGLPEGVLREVSPRGDSQVRSGILKTYSKDRLSIGIERVHKFLKLSGEGEAPVFNLRDQLDTVREYIEETGNDFDLIASLEFKKSDGRRNTLTGSYKRRQFINFFLENLHLFSGDNRVKSAVINSSGNAIQGLLFTVNVLKKTGALPDDFKVIMVAHPGLDKKKEEKIRKRYGKTLGEIVFIEGFIQKAKRVGMFRGKDKAQLYKDLLEINLTLESLDKYEIAHNKKHPKDRIVHIRPSNDESMILGGAAMLDNLQTGAKRLLGRRLNQVGIPLGGGGPAGGMALKAYYDFLKSNHLLKIFANTSTTTVAGIGGGMAIQAPQSIVREIQRALGRDFIEFGRIPEPLVYKAFIDLRKAGYEVEPTSAVTLARIYQIMSDPTQWHLLKRGPEGKKKVIGLVLSGGNVGKDVIQHAERVYRREKMAGLDFLWRPRIKDNFIAQSILDRAKRYVDGTGDQEPDGEDMLKAALQSILKTRSKAVTQKSRREAHKILIQLSAARMAVALSDEQLRRLAEWQVEHFWNPRVVDNVKAWFFSNAVNDKQRKALTGLIEAGNHSKIRTGFDSEKGYVAPGTAGARGEMEYLQEGKIGPNYFSQTTVIQYTQAFLEWYRDTKQTGSVFITKEVRDNSDLYGDIAAKILLDAGIRVVRVSKPVSTPLASYIAKYIASIDGTAPAFGFQISASHNSFRDNGIKFMGSYGQQLMPEAMGQITGRIAALGDAISVPNVDLRKNDLYHEIQEPELGEILKNYFDELDATLPADTKDLIRNATASGMTFVFTPLNGASLDETTAYFEDRLGLKKNDNFFIVEDEALRYDQLDPAEKQSLKIGRVNSDPAAKGLLDKAEALAKAKKVDLILARDPDGDRAVVSVRRKDGSYQKLDGNQNALVVFEQRARKLLPQERSQALMVRSHATTAELDAIAAEYGIPVQIVPVGFKYFGAIIHNRGNVGRLFFGAEESYGTSNGHVSEKDGLSGVADLLSVAAEQYLNGKKTVSDQLIRVYLRYGYQANAIINIPVPGADIPEKNLNKQNVLDGLAALKAGDTFGEFNIVSVKPRVVVDELGDFHDGFDLILSSKSRDGEIRLLFRASGTEAIFKAYFSLVKGIQAADAPELVQAIYRLDLEINGSIANQVRSQIDVFSKKSAARLTGVEDLFRIGNADLASGVELFLKEIQKRGTADSDLPDYRTDVPVPTGKEKGTYLYVDWGGTNLRIGGIKLEGDGKINTLHEWNPQRDPTLKWSDQIKGSGKAMVKFIARKIADYGKTLPEGQDYFLGLSFGFSSNHDDGIGSARVVKETSVKGFDFSDLLGDGEVGEDIVPLIQEELRQLGTTNITINSAPNDTGATMLIGEFLHPDTIAGGIFGTGHNASIRSKDGQSVNLEMARSSRFERNRFDEALDGLSSNPGKQLLEKAISGKYLGPLLGLTLTHLIENEGLFRGRSSGVIRDRDFEHDETYGGIRTKHLSEIAAWDLESPNGVAAATSWVHTAWGIENAKSEDLAVVSGHADAIATRSAQLAAQGFAAILLDKQGSDTPENPVGYAVDGTVINSYPGYEVKMLNTLKEIFDADYVDSYINIHKISDGSGIGAALTAAVIASQAAGSHAAARLTPAVPLSPQDRNLFIKAGLDNVYFEAFSRAINSDDKRDIYVADNTRPEIADYSSEDLEVIRLAGDLGIGIIFRRPFILSEQQKTAFGIVIKASMLDRRMKPGAMKYLTTDPAGFAADLKKILDETWSAAYRRDKDPKFTLGRKVSDPSRNYDGAERGVFSIATSLDTSVSFTFRVSRFGDQLQVRRESNQEAVALLDLHSLRPGLSKAFTIGNSRPAHIVDRSLTEDIHGLLVVEVSRQGVMRISVRDKVGSQYYARDSRTAISLTPNRSAAARLPVGQAGLGAGIEDEALNYELTYKALDRLGVRNDFIRGALDPIKERAFAAKINGNLLAIQFDGQEYRFFWINDSELIPVDNSKWEAPGKVATSSKFGLYEGPRGNVYFFNLSELSNGSAKLNVYSVNRSARLNFIEFPIQNTITTDLLIKPDSLKVDETSGVFTAQAVGSSSPRKYFFARTTIAVTRRENESIYIGNGVTLTVERINRGLVDLRVDYPSSVRVRTISESSAESDNETDLQAFDDTSSEVLHRVVTGPKGTSIIVNELLIIDVLESSTANRVEVAINGPGSLTIIRGKSSKSNQPSSARLAVISDRELMNFGRTIAAARLADLGTVAAVYPMAISAGPAVIVGNLPTMFRQGGIVTVDQSRSFTADLRTNVLTLAEGTLTQSFSVRELTAGVQRARSAEQISDLVSSVVTPVSAASQLESDSAFDIRSFLRTVPTDLQNLSLLNPNGRNVNLLNRLLTEIKTRSVLALALPADTILRSEGRGETFALLENIARAKDARFEVVLTHQGELSAQDAQILERLTSSRITVTVQKVAPGSAISDVISGLQAQGREIDEIAALVFGAYLGDIQNNRIGYDDPSLSEKLRSKIDLLGVEETADVTGLYPAPDLMIAALSIALGNLGVRPAFLSSLATRTVNGITLYVVRPILDLEILKALGARETVLRAA